MEELNTRTVRDIYAALKRGDIPVVLANLAGDVTWEMPAPPHVPWAGRHFGPDEIARHLELLNQAAELRTIEAREFIAEGDHVVAVGHYSGRSRATGREFVNDFVTVFTFRDGRITTVREYTDTAALGAAFDTGESKLTGAPGTANGENEPLAGPHTSVYRSG